MKLSEAIEYAINKDGLEIIRDRRLVSYLADLQAYETPAVRNIIATIIDEGYCDKLYKGLVKGSYQLAFNEVSYQLTHLLGFQEEIVQPVLDSVLTATQKIAVKPTIENEDTINGHEFVDLGLSVKWATCNVGASSPSGYGNYYAWGETKPKSSYDEDNSVTYGKNLGDIAGDSRYDAARANWCGTWRMPTKAEIEELRDEKNCMWKWTTQGGHTGYKVTSKKNGNSIFLPSAGNRCGSSLDDAGGSGFYWSSTSDESDARRAHGLHFYYFHPYPVGPYRYCGLTVRPVTDKSYVS